MGSYLSIQLLGCIFWTQVIQGMWFSFVLQTRSFGQLPHQVWSAALANLLLEVNTLWLLWLTPLKICLLISSGCVRTQAGLLSTESVLVSALASHMACQLHSCSKDLFVQAAHKTFFTEKDLDTPKKWAHENVMKFNKAKYKVLHFSWGNPRYVYRLREELIENSPEEKALAQLPREGEGVRTGRSLRSLPA